jgi:hypothetical protein
VTGNISSHFFWEEFACKTKPPTPVPSNLATIIEELVREILEPIRSEWAHEIGEGDPSLEVISGYRTLDHNTSVGGATHSFHMEGRAADIRPRWAADIPKLHLLVYRMWKRGNLPQLGGLGFYTGWIHVDTAQAPDGHLRQWHGDGIGSEETT